VQKYKVVGLCKVAGREPGELVTRAEVEAFGPPGAIHFDVLVGPFLEPVADGPEPVKAEPKKAPK
jgi:hypothetical protein